MPLRRGKSARSVKGMRANFKQLKKDGFKGKQRVAVALSLAGLSRKKRKRKK